MNPDNPDKGSSFSKEQGWLAGAQCDPQSVTRDWASVQPLIQDVIVKEVRNVTKNNGILTEVWRQDWQLDAEPLTQVFQNLVTGHAISSWHAHQFTTDRIFINFGLIKLVLYDGRTTSATHGMINEFRFGLVRPALVVVPPGVWHLVQNLEATPSLLLNLVDRAYDYEGPDHWRLPPENPVIPYRIKTPLNALPPSTAQV
jgi:dTDP-4-dehydrorhamnose 3,5-epimerase